MITLDKAIEILKLHRELNLVDKNPDLKDSILLSIEALKRCKVLAENSPLWAAKPLPGETPFIDTKRSLHHIKENLQGIGEHP